MSDSTRNGEIVRVTNTLRPKFTRAPEAYWALWLEQADGSGDRCYMFTDRELKASNRVVVDGLDMVYGRLYKVKQGTKCFYLVRTLFEGTDFIYRLSSTSVERSKTRADNNPEDCTKKSFWRRLTE